MSEREQSKNTRLSEATLLALLLALAGFIAVYVLLRYGGHWGEGDTSTFTRAIRSVADTGRLAPGPGYGVYINGYGYSALVVFIMNLCGLTLADVQLYGGPLLVVWLVFPAWLAFRELTGSIRATIFATLLLLTQPEVLFAVLRGTHEKFTRGLMLLCLYFLLRSLRSRHQPARFAAFIFAFYIAGYALITSNNLMASSFIVALGLAIAFIWILVRRYGLEMRWANAIMKRLAFATGILFIVSFIFLFYLYEPALHSFSLLDSMLNRTSALILDAGTQASNPYTVINDIWVSPAVYLMVSFANWLLLIPSAMLWFWQSIQWLQRRSRPATSSELLLWALFGAFALQGALSIVVDVSGALASNLQHRVFPSFAMLAAPLAGKYLAEWRPKQVITGRLVHSGVWLGIGVIAILSTLKATNEPLLSNKWLFYSPSEMQALDWAGTALQNRGLWLEYDERLFAAARIRNGASPLLIYPDWEDVDPGTRDFLISDITRSRSVRLHQPLPIDVDSFITYDNGQTQIFHRHPRTPYQP